MFGGWIEGKVCACFKDLFYSTALIRPRSEIVYLPGTTMLNVKCVEVR